MNELFYELNEFKPADHGKLRTKMIAYLKAQSEPLSGDVDEVVGAAYRIAGLAATDYMRSLMSSDPIDEILTIAGELESTPEAVEILRQELLAKIHRL